MHKRVQEAGLRQAGNMPVQGSSSELMKLAIAEVQDVVVDVLSAQGVNCYPLMTVHDEILLECESGYGDLIRLLTEDVMCNVMMDRCTNENLCRVPISAEGKVMMRWEK